MAIVVKDVPEEWRPALDDIKLLIKVNGYDCPVVTDLYQSIKSFMDTLNNRQCLRLWSVYDFTSVDYLTWFSYLYIREFYRT